MIVAKINNNRVFMKEETYLEYCKRNGFGQPTKELNIFQSFFERNFPHLYYSIQIKILKLKHKKP